MALLRARYRKNVVVFLFFSRPRKYLQVLGVGSRLFLCFFAATELRVSQGVMQDPRMSYTFSPKCRVFRRNLRLSF